MTIWKLTSDVLDQNDALQSLIQERSYESSAFIRKTHIQEPIEYEMWCSISMEKNHGISGEQQLRAVLVNRSCLKMCGLQFPGLQILNWPRLKNVIPGWSFHSEEIQSVLVNGV